MTNAVETDRSGAALDRAMGLIELLAVRVGGRRPTGPGERAARELVAERLGEWGIRAGVEPFRGYSSFAWPFGIVEALGLLPSLLPGRLRRTRSLLALTAGAALAGEGSLRFTPLSDLLRRAESGNLVATIEPRERVRRTVVLMSHLDSSRSGLMFDPRFVGQLGRWISAQSLAGLIQAAAEPLLGGSRRGRRLLGLIRLPLLGGLSLLAERELRGVDVPGANDNASGCGVVGALAAEIAADPFADTRVVVLMTGCEESGTLGAQSYLDEHGIDGTLFLNFDNVGGPCPVRFLRREGVLSKWDADPDLIATAQSVAEERPELRLEAEDEPAGLTYDATPVLARGGRALTISVQDGYIPDLHQPSDTYENIDRDGVARTLDAGREIVRRLAAGTADR